ncbi:ABC transporter substrate-binding protein [Natronorarus salvus]|uniref:ABC transporter substrate-binding protein n=1 Tax=Natronorarus salvus TaxID=3117733 RepID=UPI002F26047B
MTGRTDRTSRRAVLAGATALAGSTAGCFDRIRASVDRNPPEQVSLTIKVVPRDEDRSPIRIAQHLAENIERAGATVDIVPTTEEQLLRDVLINFDYQLYIARHPGHDDPDYLYTFLGSRFGEEAGWQNPFGYASTATDDLLERQRVANDTDARAEAFSEFHRTALPDAPITVVAYPDEPRAVRTDRFGGWTSPSLEYPLGYLSLEYEEVGDDDRAEGVLYVGINDRRPTRNLNPFAVEFRDRGVTTGLLYDPLGRRMHGSIEPWLAERWEWGGTDQRPRATLELREGLTWHDGEPITAEDVAFTYEFITDTTMEPEEDPIVPSPRFRTQSTLVDSVEVLGDHELELTFVAAAEPVAERAFTVPIVPEHVWTERTAMTTFAGFDIDYVTEALVWENAEPVGSGPFRYADSTSDESLTFERNDDHFLLTAESLTGPVASYEARPSYSGIQFEFVPSDASALEMLQGGQLDATAYGLAPEEVPAASRASDLAVENESTSSHYHVGFNTRNAPLSNPQFRYAIARLIDREYVYESVFERYATPTYSPIASDRYVPEEFRWSPEDVGEHELSFVGREDDEVGVVEAEAARELFRDAGYRYNEDNELLVQQ